LKAKTAEKEEYEYQVSPSLTFDSLMADSHLMDVQVADMRAKFYQRESDLSILRVRMFSLLLQLFLSHLCSAVSLSPQSLVAKLKGRLEGLGKLNQLGLDKHEQKELQGVEGYSKK
jgi:hypothetical protein